MGNSDGRAIKITTDRDEAVSYAAEMRREDRERGYRTRYQVKKVNGRYIVYQLSS